MSYWYEYGTCCFCGNSTNYNSKGHFCEGKSHRGKTVKTWGKRIFFHESCYKKEMIRRKTLREKRLLIESNDKQMEVTE